MIKVIFVSLLVFQALFLSFSTIESSQESEKIKQRLQKFTESLTTNPNNLSTFWTDDAELINHANGDVIDGKEQIIPFLQERIKELKERNLQFSFQPTKLEFPEDDYAIVFGIASIKDNKGDLIQRNARRVALIKDSGEWYIDSVSDIEVAPPPPLYLHLKELEWLVGNWKDEDDKVTINFDTQWNKFKNFLTQRFSMKVYGTVVMEGIQIIGWDPIKKSIRSWVYDSEGGFGSGLWSKEGDSWYAKLNFTLSDGSKAQATNVYTQLDDNSYVFSSIDRKVNNEDVPEIEPVTVTREE